MLERKTRPLLPRKKFALRLLVFAALAFALLGIALSIGIAGYRYFGGLSWIDSLLNASMILTGMGPVDQMKTDAAKLFASGYAIFSGITFPTTMGILATPVVHRFLHRLNIEGTGKSAEK